MIFCVEDDGNIRELVVYTLESTGFQARGFEDGSSFLEALALETPELVLLDIMLPGEDGMELLRKLKASTTVTMVSSRANSLSEFPSSSSKVKVSATGSGSEMPVDSITN